MESHLMVRRVKIPTVQVKGVLAWKELLEEFHNQTWQGLAPLSSTSYSASPKEDKNQKLLRICIHTIWVDGGYDGLPFFKWAIDTLRWVILVVLRPTEAKGFVLLRKRWKDERTFGWWNWCRRLSKDYEALVQTSETFLYLAMIRIMVRRLA